MKVKKAVIPAAGLGTRFLPATKAIAKEMLPIGDKPTIQYIVEEIADSGLNEVIIVLNKDKEYIKKHFENNDTLSNRLVRENKLKLNKSITDIGKNLKFTYVFQEQPNGLADAVYCAKKAVNGEPFALLLGDDVMYSKGRPVIKQLIDVFDETQKSVLGVQQVQHESVFKYGIVDCSFTDRKDVFKVLNIVEKPAIEKAPSDMAILGRYVLKNEIFAQIENLPEIPGKELMFTDALLNLAYKNALVAYNFSGKRYDAGDKLGYLTAIVEFALKDENLGYNFKEFIKGLNL